MTREQYEQYQKVAKEIEPVKSFLRWCGDKYKDKLISELFFNIISRGKQFILHKCYMFGSVEENMYEIPYELQKRIVKVIEEYVDEKEKELESL